MRTSGFGSYALTSCAAAAMLAGCGGSTSPSYQPPGMSQITGAQSVSSAAAVPGHDVCLGDRRFQYTGRSQKFTVPTCATTIFVDAMGAAGAYSANGGEVSATAPVTPGETLIVTVGGQGTVAKGGGFNGGGRGADNGKEGRGASGGGASDVRQGGDTLADRVVVAGGGGSANGGGGGGTGGTGGGLPGGGSGENPSCNMSGSPVSGGGGTQSSGGTGGAGTNGGSLGDGGAGVGYCTFFSFTHFFTYSSTGGGGGYYGGGGGATGGDGGGGSGYAEPSATNVSSQNGVNNGNGWILICWGFKSGECGSHEGRKCPTYACIYVANHSSPSFEGDIPVYARNATGGAGPYVTIGGAQTGLTKPNAVALDARGNIYVAIGSPGVEGEVSVFASSAEGNIPPLRTIAGPTTGLTAPYGIALDTSGDIYALDYNVVTVYSPDANGDVAPIRTISGSNTGMTNASGIAVDHAGNLYVTNERSCVRPPNQCTGRAKVLVYAPGASGNVAPIRTIRGAKTGLNVHGGPLGTPVGPRGVAVDRAGNAYVANFRSVTVYAPGAKGNVAPIRSIAGAKTQMLGTVSIAVDAAGRVYVQNIPSNGQDLTVFATGAKGNVAPVQILDDGGDLPAGVAVR